MNINNQILVFLGQIQCGIENLGQWASQTNNPAFQFVADLESYFNNSIDEIFSVEENKSYLWKQGITWKTLPR